MSAVTYYNSEVTVSIATRPALPCFIPPNNCNRCGAELITSGAALKHQAALEKATGRLPRCGFARKVAKNRPWSAFDSALRSLRTQRSQRYAESAEQKQMVVKTTFRAKPRDGVFWVSVFGRTRRVSFEPVQQVNRSGSE